MFRFWLRTRKSRVLQIGLPYPETPTTNGSPANLMRSVIRWESIFQSQNDPQMDSSPLIFPLTLLLNSLQARSSASQLENVGDNQVAVVDIDVKLVRARRL